MASAAPQPASDRYLRRAQVEAEAGLSRATIYRWMKTGRFPRPVEIAPGCVRWPESQIAAWKAAHHATEPPS